MTYRLRGTVHLEVEATVPFDEEPDDVYAKNILKGGYYDHSTRGIDVTIDAIEELHDA